MILAANVRTAGDVSVIDLDGRITLGTATALFSDTMAEVAASDRKNVLMNFEKVSYVDSTGLGLLSKVYLEITKGGGAVKVRNPQPRIRDLLRTTPLHRVVTFEGEDEVVRSFGPAA